MGGRGSSGTSADGLTRAEAKAIRDYTEYAFAINSLLRAGVDPSEWSADTRAMMRGLDSAMSPLASALDLTRSVDASAFPGVRDLASLIGKTVTDRAYMSTSREGGMTGGGEITMHIRAPRGTRAADATGRRSVMPNQREVILARGTRVRITGARRRPSGSWDVWGTVT